MQVPLTKNLEYSTWNPESTAWVKPRGGDNFFPCRFCQGLKKKIIAQDVENLHVDQNRKKMTLVFHH